VNSVNPMRQRAQPRAGRPTSGVLDRDAIARTALAIVDDRGYQSLTMAAVASTLGVAPSALYNHVTSKQDLLHLVQELVMDGVDHSLFDSHPLDQALRRWATSYRDVFAEHIPLIPVIAVLPVASSPRLLAMYESVAAGFARVGWEPERIVPAIVAIESFIFGSALDASAPDDIFEPGSEAERVPNFKAAIDAQRSTGRRSADAAFDAGLEALVAGLLAERTR
jgi:AcrR family transcriptional regulator